MSNPNDGYAKRKEMSVQGLACTFTLSKCAGHGMSSVGDKPTTGSYRQV